MIKKYEFTDETTEVDGHTLHRIRAVRCFSDVKAGDLGGWIEKEDNLSQIGNAWVYSNAKVYGDAKIYDDAKVYGNAIVSDNARIDGGTMVAGNTKVCGNEVIRNNANY